MMYFMHRCWRETNLSSPVFRAAMKMSNIDHCFDYMFTNPKSPQGVSHISEAWFYLLLALNSR